MTKESKPAVRPIHPQRIDLATLILSVADAYAETFDLCRIELDLDVPHNLWVDVDSVLMKEAFRKLIDNAIEAMPSGGMLTITSLIGRHGLEVEFADSGCGISDELKERLFEPYATTKHDHAGLGLVMVKDIVESHNGSVEVDDCPQGGTAFTLQIPVRKSYRQVA